MNGEYKIIGYSVDVPFGSSLVAPIAFLTKEEAEDFVKEDIRFIIRPIVQYELPKKIKKSPIESGVQGEIK